MCADALKLSNKFARDNIFYYVRAEDLDMRDQVPHHGNLHLPDFTVVLVGAIFKMAHFVKTSLPLVSGLFYRFG